MTDFDDACETIRGTLAYQRLELRVAMAGLVEAIAPRWAKGYQDRCRHDRDLWFENQLVDWVKMRRDAATCGGQR